MNIGQTDSKITNLLANLSEGAGAAQKTLKTSTTAGAEETSKAGFTSFMEELAALKTGVGADGKSIEAMTSDASGKVQGKQITQKTASTNITTETANSGQGIENSASMLLQAFLSKEQTNTADLQLAGDLTEKLQSLLLSLKELQSGNGVEKQDKTTAAAGGNSVGAKTEKSGEKETNAQASDSNGLLASLSQMLMLMRLSAMSSLGSGSSGMTKDNSLQQMLPLLMTMLLTNKSESTGEDSKTGKLSITDTQMKDLFALMVQSMEQNSITSLGNIGGTEDNDGTSGMSLGQNSSLMSEWMITQLTGLLADNAKNAGGSGSDSVSSNSIVKTGQSGSPVNSGAGTAENIPEAKATQNDAVQPAVQALMQMLNKLVQEATANQALPADSKTAKGSGAEAMTSVKGIDSVQNVISSAETQTTGISASDNAKSSNKGTQEALGKTSKDIAAESPVETKANGLNSDQTMAEADVLKAIENNLTAIVNQVKGSAVKQPKQAVEEKLTEVFQKLVDEIKLPAGNQNTSGNEAIAASSSGEQTAKNQLVSLLVSLTQKSVDFEDKGEIKPEVIRKFTELLDQEVHAVQPKQTTGNETNTTDQAPQKKTASATVFTPVSQSREDKILRSAAKLTQEDPKAAKVTSFMVQLNNQVAKPEHVESQPVVNRVTFNQDIIKAVKLMETNNLKELSVKINPKEMGEITIKLSMDQGNLKASITANTKETYHMLQTNLHDLNTQLGASDIKIHSLDIGIYQEDTTFFSQNSQGERGQQKPGESKNGNNQDSGTEELEGIAAANAAAVEQGKLSALV